MGSITTGIGLISGIDTASLIDNLIALESGPKIQLQRQLALLQAQQTALLDINARLLGLMNVSQSFRESLIFQSALATTSDDTVLTATASAAAPPPGTFKFIVKQLVSTSQKLSKGFLDPSDTPVGLSSFTLELGKGGLGPEVELANLNGGAGVDRGQITITDGDGETATIDLGDVTTLGDVIERINGNGTANVTASIDGDHLVVTDNAAGAGNLVVADGAGDTTATDLGIADTGEMDGVITGTDILFLGADTSLAALNDGNGVLIRNNVADLKITARDGTIFEIDLGRINVPIDATSELADLNNGAGVAINDDDEPDITFVDRTGTEHDVDLTGVTTVQGLIDRVDNQTSGAIVLSVAASGEGFRIDDTTGGTGLLKVLGAGPSDTQTAEDLGLLEEDGVSAAFIIGDLVPYLVDQPVATTIQDVIDRINDADDSGGDPNAGRIVAAIAADGVSLSIADTTGGLGNLKIESTAGNPYAARDLGLEADVAANTIDGDRLLAGLGSVLVRNLNGGSGLSGHTTLTITDRNGGTDTLTLDEDGSLSDIVAQINASAGIAVTASLSDTGTSLLISDESGGSGTLTIAGNAAADLGIAAAVAADSVRGTNLQHRYVSEATRLDDLNYGRGVGKGSFRLTDGTGESAIVDIGSDSKTLYNVIQEINSRGLELVARVNDTGDGLLIEGTAVDPFVKLEVEAVTGSTAHDLNIVGESETVDDAVVDGSYEVSLSVAASDTLEALADKINEAGVPVSATILNTGSGPKPYRLSITSGLPGREGELFIDTGAVDLGLTTLAQGQDAKVFFGADSAEEGFLLTSSSNSISGVVPNVTIDLLDTSDEAVTVTVKRDVASMVASVQQFVTAFNNVVATIDKYDFFDVEKEERGILLGNPLSSRVRNSLHSTLHQQAEGVSTALQFLSQVGIGIGDDGQATFEASVFEEAYANDPLAVENLFAAFEESASSSEEILPGVTVPSSTSTTSSRGFGDIFKDLADALTDSSSGALTLSGKSFDERIKLVNTRIDELDERLAAKRARLQREFAGLELALANLQGQQSALLSLSGNLTFAQNLLK